MEVNNNNRIYYLDYTKVFLTILVILHHASITYGGAGSWYYTESSSPLSAILLTIFTAVNQSYFMGFFFFIAAYFSAMSLKSKSSLSFVMSKLIRLCIPLLLFYFLFGPLTVFFAAEKGHFIYWNSLNIGPLWFLAALLLFDVIFLILSNLIKKRPIRTDFISNKSIFVALIITGILTFFVRLVFPIGRTIFPGFQLAHFPLYILLYYSGVKSYNSDWLDFIDKKRVYFWGKISVAALLLFFPLFAIAGNAESFFGGFNLFAFIASFWDGFMAIGVMMGFLYIGRTKWNERKQFLSILSRNSFASYVLHAPLLTLVAIYFSGNGFPPLMKFSIVGLISVVLCYFISSVSLTMFPLVKKVF